MENVFNEVAQMALEIYKFDHTYIFSDDYRVWKQGEEEKERLVYLVKKMNLSLSDKLFMIEIFENLWNDHSFSTQYDKFSVIDIDHTLWPYKSSMYSIAGITPEDLMFSPIK